MSFAECLSCASMSRPCYVCPKLTLQDGSSVASCLHGGATAQADGDRAEVTSTGREGTPRPQLRSMDSLTLSLNSEKG